MGDVKVPLAYRHATDEPSLFWQGGGLRFAFLVENHPE